MAIKKVMTIYDNIAELYGTIYITASTKEAMRDLLDLQHDETCKFGKHPNDYILMELGTFDDLNGSFIPYSQIQRIGSILELQELLFPTKAA